MLSRIQQHGITTKIYMSNDLQLALDNFRLSASRYARYQRYYDGDHDLAFASAKFQNTFGSLFREFALNLCPVVCDAVRDKLRIRCDSDIWRRSRMGLRSGEVHKEALRCGDAYMIVWPDAEGRATLFPNRAASITVAYDDENPGEMLWAAKWWATRDKRVRVNLFYPDRVERFVSRQQADVVVADARSFVPFEGEIAGGRENGALVAAVGARSLSHSGHVSPNPFGMVPVFHFANNADVGDLGRSELEAAIPIQDGLNKSVLDMLVAMEFAAYRQRWAAGIEIEFDNEGRRVAPFKAGVEHLWISENPQATFGDFAAADLEQFLKVKDSFRVDIASVTGTPLHYFLQESGFASGVSLRQNETRFNAKVRDRQASFGQVWEDAMRFAMKIEGTSDTEVTIDWEDPAALSEKELLEERVLESQL